MQLISTLAAIAALATVAVSQFSGSSAFFLTLNYTATNESSPGLDPNDFYTQFVSFANGSLFIGQASTDLYSEPFYAAYGGGGIGFTSYHESPTGFTSLFLFPNDTMPVGLTIPHSGGLLPGTRNSGFGFNTDGYLTFGGVNNFIGCTNSVKNSFQIFWLGDLSDTQDPLGSSCIGPLFLYRTRVTLSVPY